MRVWISEDIFDTSPSVMTADQEIKGERDFVASFLMIIDK